ncbi:MAG: preprotein translocase subunit SecE [Phycisphaerae bacterium]|nr:preprotein translocase subunit SecE [Phycisphaerae bacterium]
MSAVIYKAGQGYWVRALSAVFFGVLVLAAAAWGWAQAGAFDLPVAAYTYRVSNAAGDIAPGQTLELRDLSLDGSDTYVTIGTGVIENVEQINTEDARVRLGSIAPANEDADVTSVKRLAGAAGAPYAARVESFDTHRVFPPVYLQAAVAGAIILIGAVALYWFVGANPKSCEFLIATDGEMRKVNWSTPREIRGSTIVVIVAAFLIAAILWIIDLGFQQTFDAIGVLET